MMSNRVRHPQRQGERQITGRMVLFALIGFFGFITLVNLVMVRAAITTFGGVDTPSSYRAGLAFTAEERRAAAQEARDWDVSVRITSTSNGAAFAFQVEDSDAQPIVGAEVTARLAHVIDERRDLAIDVAELGAGSYSGRAAAEPGRWVLEIEIARDGERLFRSRNRVMIE